MNEKKQALMKLFSSILKERAKGDSQFKEFTPDLLRYFGRKELIEIINTIYNGAVPEEYNLVETENQGLLKLIGDDLFVISYVTKKWSEEVAALPHKPAISLVPDYAVVASTPTDTNSAASEPEVKEKEKGKGGANKN